MNKKKWSCPSCTYESGRWFNVKRHIGRRHLSGVPELNPEYGSDRLFSYRLGRESVQSFAKRNTSTDSFTEKYQFEHKGWEIFQYFMEAQRLPPGQTKHLGLADLFMQTRNLNAPGLSSNILMDYFRRQTTNIQAYNLL